MRSRILQVHLLIIEQKEIHYNKCNKIGCQLNHSAEKMHKQYKGLLEQFQIDSELYPQFAELMHQSFEKMSKEVAVEKKRLSTQLTEVKKKKDTLERRYAYGEIEQEIYQKFIQELRQEELAVEAQIEQLTGPLSNHQELVGKGLQIGLSSSQSWANAEAADKRKLQALLFPEGVYFDCEKEAYRTTRVNSFFALSSQLTQILRQKERGKTRSETDFSALVAHTRSGNRFL